MSNLLRFMPPPFVLEHTRLVVERPARGIAAGYTACVDADVIVAGAGAAGLMAAFTAAERGAEVLLLDSRPAIGAKILVAGGGRCNVTNARISADCYNAGSSAFVAQVLAAFPLSETREFFAESGVRLKEEEAGKLFPTTNSSQTVLDALLSRLKASHARLRAGAAVRNVAPCREGWRVETERGVLSARAVILCTGGLALPKSGSTGDGYKLASRLGHHVVWTTPALSPLLADPPIHAALSGITLPVRLSLVDEAGTTLASAEGSFLFTHHGYSGPAALDLSRHVVRLRREHTNATVVARYLPHVPPGGERKWLDDLVRTSAGRTAFGALNALLPKRLADHIAHTCGAPADVPLGRLNTLERRLLADAVLNAVLPVSAVDGYRKAEATAGGVCLDEVDPDTMMSRLAPGFFLAGEVLDVDGRLGGYNFQWAWSSGAVAGRAAAAYAARNRVR